MFFSGYQFDDIFIRLCRVLHGSSLEAPRGEKTKEIINANIELRIPCRCILVNPVRRQSKRYLERELKWYLSGTNRVDYIREHAKRWGEVADPDGTVNSAYGWQIFSQMTPYGGSQLDYVVNELRADRASRRAVININQVMHKYETNDIPCTVSLQFLFRGNCLVQVATMRSTDIVWGLCNDLPFFSMVQMIVANELLENLPTLRLGSLFLNTASLHTYERHFGLIEKVAYLNCGATFVSTCFSDFLSESTTVGFHGFGGDCCGEFSKVTNTDDDGADKSKTWSDTPNLIYPVI